MQIFYLLIVILTVKICYSEFVQVFHPFKPVSPPLAPICAPTQHQLLQPLLVNSSALEKSKDKMKFILPFLDMEIQNDRNVHIMQEVQKQKLYVLHGHELYQLFISRQEKRLSLMGVLEGDVRHVEPLGAKIIYWQGNLLLVIALDEHLEVYQLSEDVLNRRAEIVKDPARAHEPAPIFEAIQQLTLTGGFQKLFLISPSKNHIMIIAAVNFTKLYGKLRIFEWLSTYFNPIEEKTVPVMHMVDVIGFQTKYLVTGRLIKHQDKTILNVYEISHISPNLFVKQTLTVESRVVHVFTYLNRNMIVACSNKQQKCSSFRQIQDGHFSAYRHRTSKEFAFDLMVSSPGFVSATRKNQVMVFTNHRLDCYGSFISDQSDATSLIGYQNSYKENYVLLLYKRPFKALVRIVELEISANDFSTGNQTEQEEVQASNRHQHLFESTIGNLRSLLLRRKADMDVFRKLSKLLKPKLKDIEVEEPISLQAGKVGIIKVVGEYLKSPKQITQKIESLRQNYVPQRSKRSDIFNNSMEVINRIKVQRIKVENLIYSGDVIEGFSLKQNNSREQILTIKPKVFTHSLNTSVLILPENIRHLRQQIVPDIVFNVAPSLRVNHLKVAFINGVAWNEFYNSLFLKNRDKVIEGRLILQSQVNVKHLKATILNGLVVSNLFNLKHPQVIHSDLVISRVFAYDLRIKTVNGLIFEQDIVFNGSDTFIETPVKIHHLSISGDLFLANNSKAESLGDNPDKIDFDQFYTNKVIVNGSLIVNNLKRINNTTKIILGEQEFLEHKIKETYLLREQAQNFSFPVIFGEAKITAPALTSNYLNSHKTGQHMLVNKVNTDKPLLLVFMNAHVQGDIVCRDYKSKIAEIKENIIKPGDKVYITGTKLFQAHLEVNNVDALTLNQLPAKNLVFKTLLNNNATIQFKDLKTFTAIKAKNPSYIEKTLQASYLNNLPLETLLNNDYHMERLVVPHLVEMSNLVFRKINGIPFDEFFKKFDVKDEHLILHKDLIVEGNIHFAENLELHYINNILWDEYVDNLVRLNENAAVEGDVIFQKDLTITNNFETKQINGQDLEFILKNVLMKSKPQLITGFYHFDNMTGSNIDVMNINGINVSEFINLSKNLTVIEGDIIVENLNIGQNLQGKLNEFESLVLIKEKIKQLPLKPWTNLYVLNNASWPENIKDNYQQQLLKYFYKFAVRSNRDQTITGNVQISRPIITNMQTRLQFPPNLDIDFILQDGLLKNSDVNQIIEAEKVFLKPLILENLKVKHLNTQFLNKVDVLYFNQTLYRLNRPEPIKGPLQFIKPLIVNHLQVNGLVNGLNTTSIYQLQPNSLLPDLNFKELYVENDLYIKNINNISFEYFLDNRLTLKGPALEQFGVLTFENLIIRKNALIQSINGIAIDNMVFKHSPTLQTITGHKTFEGVLVLAGPAHVMRINNKDIMELYRNSLMKNNNYDFVNLFIDQATFEGGLQMFSNLSYDIQQRSQPEIQNEVASDEEKFLRFLKEFTENLTHSNKNIIYLDYDLNAEIIWLDSQQLKTDHTISQELSRVSCCEKQYLQISFQYPNNIYLQNITSNRLSYSSNKISIKAENYCKYKKRQVRSKVTISDQKLLKVFGMKSYVETIYTLNDTLAHFVILHVLDLPSLKRNEVRIFKISTQNNTIEHWQSLAQNIGEQLKLYKLSNLYILITNGLIDHHPAVTIYHFNSRRQLFKKQQIIDGDYDIIEVIEMPDNKATKQLILSCSKCQRIFIYELNISGKYEILQIIALKSPIDKLVIFCLNHEYYMLVISQPYSNFYNVYKYAHIQGWLHLTFGYFPNLRMSIPLTQLWSRDDALRMSASSDGLPLILLCNIDNCFLVKAIV